MVGVSASGELIRYYERDGKFYGEVIGRGSGAQGVATPPASSTYPVAQASYYQQTRYAQPTTYSAGYESGIAGQMLAQNNAVRARRGLRPHRLSSRLNQAAQNQANYMAQSGSFSHYSNGGPQSRARMAGYGGGVRENIAMGQSSVSTVFTDWQNSSGHYASIVSDTDLAGFGYARSSSGQGYWVAVYGRSDGRE